MCRIPEKEFLILVTFRDFGDLAIRDLTFTLARTYIMTVMLARCILNSALRSPLLSF